jgi:hypothetical protein
MRSPCARRRASSLAGLNAKGVQNREEAKARAEALRPVLVELAGRSARAIAAELNARGKQRRAAVDGTRRR